MEDAARAFVDAWARLMRRACEDRDTADALWRAVEAQRAAWSALAGAGAAGAADPLGAAALARFLDPSAWLFGAEMADDPAIRRLLAMPDGEDMGREGLARGPEAQALRQALAAHRAMVTAAYGRMAERMARAALDDPPQDLLSAQARWVDAAAAERDALQGSDAFLASQAAVLRAALALRAAEAAAVEGWRAARGLAGRGEVEELQRTVAALRRELRAMRREQQRP